MNAGAPERYPAALRGRRQAIAASWQGALMRTSFVPLSGMRVRQHLLAATDQAIAVLLNEPFEHAAARAIGMTLARLYQGHPEVLGGTLEVLARELVADLSAGQRAALQPRLVALLTGVAVGFTAQARDTILAEQESIRSALLAARQQAEEALQASEARFRAVYDGAAIGIGIADVAGRVIETNAAMQSMLGYDGAEMRGMRVTADFAYPDDAATDWGLYQELVAGQRNHFRIEKRFYHKEGRLIWTHLTVSLVRDVDGQPRFAIAMMEDITERKQGETALRDSEAQLRAIVTNVPLILFAFDRAGVFTQVEGQGATVLGLRPDELVGRSVFDVYRAVPQFVRDAGRALAGEAFSAITQVAGVTFEVAYAPLRDRDGTIARVIGVATDVSERAAFEARLARQAFHDALTDLPNRAFFIDRLAYAMARAERRPDTIAVLFLDLDGFKVINDSLGHTAGDQLLVAVAARLQGCVRPGDTVARIGGDEFTILLEDLAEAREAIRIAEQITARLGEGIVVGGHEVFITPSIGIAFNGAVRGGTADLLRDADMAMYHIKRTGRAGVAIFDQSMNAAALERLDLETELRRAIGRDECGEFRLHYQPLVDLASGRIVGLEALVRWAHPRRGLLPPDAFIPLTEETGLILPLGRWVLTEACRQVGEWHRRFPDVPPPVLSVNLSARQLLQPDLVAAIAGILHGAGLSPCHLRLELTESVLMTEAQSGGHALRALRGLGVELAIDDFGTGYSSLGYLRHLPVQALKLDRAFVAGLGREDEDTAIVRAVITLAHTMKLNVVAEGVETTEQLAQLRALGCELGQGYYFARPLVPGEIDALLRRELVAAGPPSLPAGTTRPADTV